MGGALFVSSGCTSFNDTDEELAGSEDTVMHTCLVNMNVEKSSFDNAPQSRASRWNSGDRVYITFKGSNGQSTKGYAEYSDGQWQFNYYGMLQTGSNIGCTAVYFDNASTESGSVVNLTENTGIYEDNSCSYSLSGGVLNVTATLKPKTGRIRFSGAEQETITLYGITHYVAYDWSTGKYVESDKAVTETVAGGYTPYVYGYMTDTDSPRINLISSTSGFTRPMTASVYSAGKSGYMAIPSSGKHTGWQEILNLRICGVDFTMIPVENGANSFLLAETLTTEQLYKAVMEESSVTSQLPMKNVSPTDFDTFSKKLAALTDLKFRFPTSTEWVFAAKGGNQSKGYTYAGSNVLNEVGWYSGNSGNTLHEVKQLMPNELGFYDMSGLLSECTVSSSSYKEGYGGSYSATEGECKISANVYKQYYFSSNYADLGFRLALSNK